MLIEKRFNPIVLLRKRKLGLSIINTHVIIIKNWSVHLMVTLKNSRNNANFFNIRITEVSFNRTLITVLEFKTSFA